MRLCLFPEYLAHAETVETVMNVASQPATRLKPGENERNLTDD